MASFMADNFDVLGLGSVALDELLYVDEYPAPDAKKLVRHRLRQCGGLTATALMTVARLGGRAAYAGILGVNDASEEVLKILREQGVDVTHVEQRPEGGPIQATIIVDETNHTRTILVDLTGSVGADPTIPTEETIRSAGALFVDHYGIEGMIRAAKIARAANVPVVADLERHEWPGFHDLLALVDHLILSRDFVERLTGNSVPEEAMEQLWTFEREVVVITAGKDGCWYRSRETGEKILHQSAFPVEVVDTTGCGDVFHGTYAWSLSQDWSIAQRLKFASAAAAIKATRRGGQPALPTRNEIEEFLKKRE